MRTVRRGCFETNSSSVHSISICSENQWNRFFNSEIKIDRYDQDIFVDQSNPQYDEDSYLTFRQWYDNTPDGVEPYYCKKETPKGEKIVVYGKSGYDG